MTDYPNNISTKLEIIKASEITPKEVRWLWYPYIPFGKVTLLQGDPGDGKSKLMLSLAALLSKGAPLPFADEDESGEPMTVIYQTTEDDADDGGTAPPSLFPAWLSSSTGTTRAAPAPRMGRLTMWASSRRWRTESSTP